MITENNQYLDSSVHWSTHSGRCGWLFSYQWEKCRGKFWNKKPHPIPHQAHKLHQNLFTTFLRYPAKSNLGVGAPGGVTRRAKRWNRGKKHFCSTRLFLSHILLFSCKILQYNSYIVQLNIEYFQLFKLTEMLQNQTITLTSALTNKW